MQKLKILLLWIVSLILVSVTQAQNISLWEFLTQYFDQLWAEIPASYKYIELKYDNISPNDAIYWSLQKAVYLDAFPNANITLPYRKSISEIYASQIISNAIGISVPAKDKILSQEWLDASITYIKKYNVLNKKRTTNQEETNQEETIQEKIMQNVYRTLKHKYLNSDTIDDNELSYGAIKWFVEAANDPFTKFFPPQEAVDFDQEMEGEYEWIWVYIDLPSPGKLMIVSVFDNSPAQKAGIKGWDQITQINQKPITQYTNIHNVTSQIKWPEWTTVILTIKRVVWGKEINFDVTVKRTHIEVEDLTTDYSNLEACVIKLNMFDQKIYNSFLWAAQKAKDLGCNQYIIDLRDNPGGSLEEVARILDHFVPAGQTSVVVKTKDSRETYVSEGLGDNAFLNKKIVVLIDKGSASASEIFAGTLKDYGSNVILIWEQSFGKGTVQQIINYGGGSMLKVTIAKRFTWKTEKDINGIGLKPDFTIINDPDTEMDEQLEAAKKWLKIH